MPNWCSNVLTIRSEDEEILDEIIEAAEAGKLLQYLRPNPSGEWDYDWSVAKWGTKWDVECYGVDTMHLDEDYLILDFDSAWSAPIEAVEWAEKTLGLECQLWFYECGVGLLGEYEGGETTYYDLPRTREEADRALNEIPEYLINAFRLEEEFNMMFEE